MRDGNMSKAREIKILDNQKKRTKHFNDDLKCIFVIIAMTVDCNNPYHQSIYMVRYMAPLKIKNVNNKCR